jgi:hypothetical protein
MTGGFGGMLSILVKAMKRWLAALQAASRSSPGNIPAALKARRTP